MVRNLEIFFSNSLEILYQQLKSSLFGSSTTPFMRRLVVVYGPAMKTWLMVKMAQDPELKVAMGIEFIYLNQAFESLLKLTSSDQMGHFPNQIELALGIENELIEVIQNFNLLESDEQHDLKPLLQYLKVNPQLESAIKLSRKVEKRLISLSQHLARLFQDYGRYAGTMVSKWELSTFRGWQPYLWRKLFGKKMGWNYPARAFELAKVPTVPFTLHFFSISFIAACEFTFLTHLSEHIPISYYMLSPCAVFWSDIRSDRETSYLQTYWQQRLGVHSPKVIQLEELLRDRNPLLANFGRLGREMVYHIEESQAQTYAHYVLLNHLQTLNEDSYITNDLYLLETQKPLSLLHALQADLLLMRNPQDFPPFNFEEENGSLQLHITPNCRREVEILYHNLLELIAKDSSISPSDIIVMAPQIREYVPYIQSIFGLENSRLDFQILDLGMQTQSEIVQGFLQLLNLSESRWNTSELLQLFEHISFQRRHQLTPEDYSTIHEWIEQAGIRWGDDWLHRNELLQQAHCEQGMVDETQVGTWDYGLSRLLLGLTTIVDTRSTNQLEIAPCTGIDFSQGELLEKWIRLLHSLRDDLSPLKDRTLMVMDDWVNYMVCLLENYFQPDFENAQSLKEYEDLKAQLEALHHSSRFFKETSFSFTSVKSHLLSLLQLQGLTYREDHLHAIQFCSLMPLRSIPAKVIAILGLQEGTFPRSGNHSSLNEMLGQEKTDYSPSPVDYDRYSFLEALHSAQDYLLLSYQGYGKYDSKELQPSLVVSELLSYLDKFYMIQGKKISQRLIFKHPFDAFDERYFAKEKCLSNFSQQDYRTAKKYYEINKSPTHCFLNEFTRLEHPQLNIIENNSQIDLKNLISVARNPIKFYLNRVLEIYLQTDEDRKLKIEEDLILSPLDKHVLKQIAIKKPIETVLNIAEKEGKLPFGLFKTVAINRFKEDVEEMHESLKKHSIDPTHIFQIEFCSSCSYPIQLDEDKWLFPAIVLSYENHYKLSIIGKLDHVTSKGYLALSKATLSDTWKVWPQFLLYCSAAKFSPQQLEPQLILSQSREAKKAFFNDPEPYLKRFIDYYALCHQNFSPLLPDWIPFILENDALGLQNKMKQLFSESFGVYQNSDLRWILNKDHLPSSEKMINEWKSQAEELMGDLKHFWYKNKFSI